MLCQKLKPGQAGSTGKPPKTTPPDIKHNYVPSLILLMTDTNKLVGNYWHNLKFVYSPQVSGLGVSWASR